jgi:AbiV family abortive infection protein
MKTRQFKQLAGKGFTQRLPLLIEGLAAIATNVRSIAAELNVCVDAQAYRAAKLLRNISREEAGKFLVLIDSCRAPGSDQATISRQFERAGNHLAKLIYAQVADYSIASQPELLRAIDGHRQALYLDGPNDYDWIFLNELIAERENALYVDLVESEGALGWSSPCNDDGLVTAPKSLRLVEEIMKTGIVSQPGFPVLQEAWRGFDPTADTHHNEWVRRSTAALEAFAAQHEVCDGWDNIAGWVAYEWPMPMVAIDIKQVDVTAEELSKRREALHEARMMCEYGLDDPAERWDV